MITTGEIVAIPDHNQNIKFWLEALSNPELSDANKKLLNKCLERELNNYVYPIIKFEADKIEDIEIRYE